MILDKAGLLAEVKLRTETVKLNGGEVIVSEVNAFDWSELVTSDECKTDGKIDERKLQPKLVAMAVLTEAGERMFTDEEAVLFASCSKKPFKKIVNAIMKLNGLSGQEVKN